MHRCEFSPQVSNFPFSLPPIQGSRLLLNLRSLSDPSRTEIEMTDISTSLHFTGRPRPSTTIGGSEFRGNSYSIDARTDEDHRTEIGGGNKLGTIEEFEIGSPRSNGSSHWNDL